MSDQGYLKATGQFWKLWVAGASLVGGAMVMWLSRYHFSRASDMQLAGPAIALLGGVWACWAIECTACKAKLLWHAVAKQQSARWLTWLLALSNCPLCGASGARDGRAATIGPP